ncbi:hypothetical protein Tco_0668339 [Tanacetum coccineum]
MVSILPLSGLFSYERDSRGFHYFSKLYGLFMAKAREILIALSLATKAGYYHDLLPGFISKVICYNAQTGLGWKEKILRVLKVWILRKIHLNQYDADFSLSSFITIARGGSSSTFTFFNLPAGAELVLEAEELLLPLAGAEDGSFNVIPFKVSALNMDFDFKIDLTVFGPKPGSAPSASQVEEVG